MLAVEAACTCIALEGAGSGPSWPITGAVTLARPKAAAPKAQAQ
jgi:hypothetical protein